MSVSVEIHAPQFSPYLASAVVDVNGRTVRECLDDLVKQFPELKSRLFDSKGRLHTYLSVYVNGKSPYPKEMTKSVKAGDRLLIVNTIAGG